MSYTKKTWAIGETVVASDLNNIEAGLDDIHNQICTLTGRKTFDDNNGVLIRGALGGEVWLEKSSTSDLIEIWGAWNNTTSPMLQLRAIGYGGVSTVALIEDLFTHDHDGGTQGAKVSHANLNDVFSDQHHDRNHGTRHAVGGADALSVGAPVAIATANQEGSATNYARRDHVHAHDTGYAPNAHHNQAHSPSDHTDRDIVKSHVFYPGGDMLKWDNGLANGGVASIVGFINQVIPYVDMDLPPGTPEYFGGVFTTPTEYVDGGVDNIIVSAQVFLNAGTVGKKVQLQIQISETREGSGNLSTYQLNEEITLTGVDQRELIQAKFDVSRISPDFRTVFGLYVRRISATSDEYDGTVQLEAFVVEFTQDQ